MLRPLCELKSEEQLTCFFREKDNNINNAIEVYANSLIDSIILTLNSLDHVLSIENERTSKTYVPILSVQSLRVVYTSVEILWHWGIKIGLGSATCFSLPDCTIASSMLISKKVIEFVLNRYTKVRNNVELLDTLCCVQRIVCNETFIGLMLPRNLERILLGFLFFASGNCNCSEMCKENEKMNGTAELVLEQLQRSHGIATMIITKLRAFAKSTTPNWLKSASFALFNNILQSSVNSNTVIGDGCSAGLEAVLNGYLEGMNCCLFILVKLSLYSPPLYNYCCRHARRSLCCCNAATGGETCYLSANYCK